MVENITETPLTGDAEATIYAGMTIFALTAELAQRGLLGQLETALDPSDPVESLTTSRGRSRTRRDTWKRALKRRPAPVKVCNGALQLFEKEFVQLLGTPDPSLSSGSSDLSSDHR